jgi:DNA modification methylase
VRIRRRALSHAPAAAEHSHGPEELGHRLVEALDVRLDDRAVSQHVHGFHSYPARLHPDTARLLLETLSTGRDRVLDPFCGSGTVLVEGRRLGRQTTGIDANPFAVALARLKTSRIDADQAARLLAAAEKIASHADERRKSRAGPTHSYGPEDRELYEVHVLLELDGIRDGLRRVPRGAIRNALDLAFSAILVKVSRQPGDTAHDRQVRRFAAGYTIRLFFKKVRELTERLLEYSALLPPRVSPPRVLVGDARTLTDVDDATIDLIVTSPPYPGVYDYVEHHAVRLRWLGIEASGLSEVEIGARRSGKAQPSLARREWERALSACLESMRRVLRPEGHAALVIADSVLGGQAARADEYVPRLAARAGLVWLAGARQPRPHAHPASRKIFEGATRYEHILVFACGRAPR